MPAAKAPLPPHTPAPLTPEEVSFIKQTVCRFYGDDAVVRNWGANPEHIDIHVEADRNSGHEIYECLGQLMLRIDRPIGLEVTKRGSRISGNAKLAYRSGEIL